MREYELLRHVYAASRDLGPSVFIPPGDDMAAIDLASPRVLAAVDQVVEGRHFTSATSVEQIGRKAMTRCLSDVAAMAATPAASLVAVCLPTDLGTQRALALFEAMRRAAAEWGCPLVGGDISIHMRSGLPLVCAVTVLATPFAEPSPTRAAARPGDRVYVTGRLGGSVEPDGGGRHLTFSPRIPEAQALASRLGARLHAMIDLSDGLGRDATSIAVASRTTIEIDASRIPCSSGLDWRRAAGDGEDYELLFTADGEVPAHVGEGVPVTEIGVVRAADGAPAALIREGDRIHDAARFGWEHVSGGVE